MTSRDSHAATTVTTSRPVTGESVACAWVRRRSRISSSPTNRVGGDPHFLRIADPELLRRLHPLRSTQRGFCAVQLRVRSSERHARCEW